MFRVALWSVQTVPDKGITHSVVGYTKRLANLIETETFSSHGYGALKIALQRMVLSVVFGVRHNDKVLKAVIQLIAI
jgi:hypothetical protein